MTYCQNPICQLIITKRYQRRDFILTSRLQCKIGVLEAFTVTHIGVPGAFFRGGQQFLSAKTESCSAKKCPVRGGRIFQFCSAKLMYHSFVSHCSASLNLGQKLLNDDSKTGKNGRKIGKFMAETKQKWLKTLKN